MIKILEFTFEFLSREEKKVPQRRREDELTSRGGRDRKGRRNKLVKCDRNFLFLMIKISLKSGE